MYLKRIHEGGKCVGVRVLHTGTSREQNFSTRLVFQAAAEGWLTIAGDVLTIAAQNAKLVYKVTARPGYYCVHDGEPMPDAATARMYVAQKFAGVPSPDPGNPAGYGLRNHFECVLDPVQHDRFRTSAGARGTLGDEQVREQVRVVPVPKKAGVFGWLSGKGN